MDFNSISARHSRDKDMPDRAFRLSMYKLILEGKFYDILPYAFHEEEDSSGEYIKVQDRRPSVTYHFLRQVVEDSVSFLFGEARFPSIDCVDELVRDTYQDIVAESKLVNTMREAALKGAAGSVVVYMRVLKSKLYFKAMETFTLTPFFDPNEPDVMIRLREKYKVRGKDLLEQGYAISEDNLQSKYWFQRIYDTTGEWWYVPWLVSKDKDIPPVVPTIDKERSVTHKLGFLPMVWIKNLPSTDEWDGESTIAPALDMAITIDYQLSQAARALRYSADPTLLLKEPAQTDGTIARTASNAIVVDEKGDARLLEINGTAANAVLDFVKWLRECALEALHANRASADRMSAAQSGAALKLHYAPMIQMADSLRATYGDGLVRLAQMIRAASEKTPIKVYGKTIAAIPMSERINLRWPEFFVSTPHDDSLQAATLKQLREGGMISRETAVKELAAEYDINDVPNEISLIKTDEAENDAREMALAAALAQVKISSQIA